MGADLQLSSFYKPIINFNMMKNLLFTAIMLLAFTKFSNGQVTYYWASGNGNFTSLGGTNWSTTPGGAAEVSRSATSDILVFDGVTVSFEIGGTTIGKLDLRNVSDVTIQRPSSPTSGTSTINLSGVAGIGLAIDNSKLRIQGDGVSSAILAFASGIRGMVNNNGEIHVNGSASNRITLPLAATLTFENGTKAFVNSGGNPFNNNSNSADFGVKFKSGSSLIYGGGLSPQGNTSAGKILDFEKGSDFIMETSYSASINLFNNKTFSNVIIRNNSTVALNENFYKIDNLTIEPGSTFRLRASGTSPVAGNIINNGVLGVVSPFTTSQLLMIGTSAQTITGMGTFLDLGGLSVGTDANVTLGSSINLAGTSTSSITGTLNSGTNSLTGSSNFQFRSAATTTSSTVDIIAGNNVLVFPTSINYDDAGVSVGLKIVGTGIPNDTYIIATSSGNRQITISNPPTATISSATITISSTSPTLKTAHINGADGAIQLTGTLTFGTGSNFIYDSPTTTPFPAISNNNIGDVTFNALATTNRSVTMMGKLTLNNAKFIIRPGDNLNITSSGAFEGTFNQNSYVATNSNSATGEAGKLILNGLASTVLIPVGTVSNYAPVTLSPATLSDFGINVFEEATVDATPNGTPLSADQKKRIVNAVWDIHRTSGSGNCDVTLGWTGTLEGSEFAGFTNSQIGIASYNGSAYSTFTGSGDNAVNTASVTVSSFSPMIIGELNTTLPVRLISFTAKENLNSVNLSWKTTSEKNLAKYIIQHLDKGSAAFKNIYTVAAHNVAGTFDYSYTDVNAIAGINYYRLISEDIDGTQYLSEIKSVNLKTGHLVAIYPNPVSDRSFSVSGLLANDIIKISDLKGQVILIHKNVNGDAINKIDLENIKSGVYLLSIENSGKVSTTKRFVKL